MINHSCRILHCLAHCPSLARLRAFSHAGHRSCHCFSGQSAQRESTHTLRTRTMQAAGPVLSAGKCIADRGSKRQTPRAIAYTRRIKMHSLARHSRNASSRHLPRTSWRPRHIPHHPHQCECLVALPSYLHDHAILAPASLRARHSRSGTLVCNKG